MGGIEPVVAGVLGAGLATGGAFTAGLAGRVAGEVPRVAEGTDPGMLGVDADPGMPEVFMIC